MTRLVVEDLSVDLAGRRVVDAVALDAEGGRLVGLIGPNGAGKSTALRAIAGLGPRRSGRVSIDAVPVERLSPRALARRLAYLPQGQDLRWPLAVEHLVGLGRLPHRGPLTRPGPADAAAVARAMARAEVTAFAHRPADTLSGGERARVLLARVLAVEAPILLADEPVASLDPHHQLQVMELLREAARGGDLVVCVLHDLALAARFCDRLVLMAKGRVQAAGPPAEVLAPAHLDAAYAVATLEGRHEDEPWVIPWRRTAHCATPEAP